MKKHVSGTHTKKGDNSEIEGVPSPELLEYRCVSEPT